MVALILGGSMPVVAAQEALPILPDVLPPRRLTGGDRIQTAVNIAVTQFPNGSEDVYLARSDVFADAVAGGVLTNGPVLLVPPDGPVPEAVLSAVFPQLRPDRVVALGGESAVTDQALADLSVGRESLRLAGSDRAATAVESEAHRPDAADSDGDGLPDGAEVWTPVNPRARVGAALHGRFVRGGSGNPGTLRLVDYDRLPELRGRPAPPPPGADAVEIDIVKGWHAPFHLTVQIGEEAEPMVGPEIFAALEARIAAADGIDQAVHVDRDVIHLVTRLPHARVRQIVRAALRAPASGA